MGVPLLDLTRENLPLLAEIKQAIEPILQKSSFILGEDVAKLEEECRNYFELKQGFTCGVSSGTDAQLLALMALAHEPGSEYITTPFTFFATAGVIARAGLKIRFADIEEDTFNISPLEIKKQVNASTAGIMPVHLYGQSADMTAIMQIARERHLSVIEDACQSMGARHQGIMCGNFGDFTSISFFPTKNLGAFGDAGLIVSTREDLKDKTFRLRVHGMKNRYEHLEVGGNFRLDTLQAAVLRVKLKHLNNWHERRRQNAKLYYEIFSTAGLAEEIVLPVEKEGNYHIYNQFVIRVKNGKRDALKAWLDERQIGNMIYYPTPLHLQACFKHLGYHKGDFPIAERACEEVLALPIHPFTREEEISEVVTTIRTFYGK